MESFGVRFGELMDWYGFYLWENDPDNGPTDDEKIAFLNDYKRLNDEYEARVAVEGRVQPLQEAG